MYLCICNALTEKRVRDAAQRAAKQGCPKTVYRELGCKPQCGICLSHVKQVLTQECAGAGQMPFANAV